MSLSILLAGVLGLLAIGLYAVLISRNLIKVIVALQILVKSAMLAMIRGAGRDWRDSPRSVKAWLCSRYDRSGRRPGAGCTGPPPFGTLTYAPFRRQRGKYGSDIGTANHRAALVRCSSGGSAIAIPGSTAWRQVSQPRPAWLTCRSCPFRRAGPSPLAGLAPFHLPRMGWASSWRSLPR